MKIKKLLLQDYIESTKEWTGLYPQTSGDMVIGQVSDSYMLDGKTSDKFMPSTFSSYMEIQDTTGTPQGIACNRIMISNTFNDASKVARNTLWVKGKAYINNGKEVATLNDVDTKCSNLQSTIIAGKVTAASRADTLNYNPKINGVTFSGNADINIQMFVASSTAPTASSDLVKLWIDTSDSTIHYYKDGKWNPIHGEWA